MARAHRVQIPGMPHHVIQRGVDRTDIFRSGADYAFLLARLRSAAATHHTDVHTYVLMTNHLHLLVTPRTETALSKMMKSIGETYAGYFNRVYKRTGALFDGRYRSLVVDSEAYWFTCMRYVELNPVRAGMVVAPEDYRWSSYRAHAFGAPDDLIVPHPMFLALGRTDALRQMCWRAICGEALSEGELTEIRDLVHRGRRPKGVRPQLTGV